MPSDTARDGDVPPSRVTSITSYLVSDVRLHLIVVESAMKHGVDEDDIVHALSHHGRTFDVGNGMTMVIGPSRTGAPLEVGVKEWYGDLAALHAMPARPKFLEGWA